MAVVMPLQQVLYESALLHSWRTWLPRFTCGNIVSPINFVAYVRPDVAWILDCIHNCLIWWRIDKYVRSQYHTWGGIHEWITVLIAKFHMVSSTQLLMNTQWEDISTQRFCQCCVQMFCPKLVSAGVSQKWSVEPTKQWTMNPTTQ